MSKIPTRGPLDDSVKLGIPSVTTDPESLRRATIALTRAMEELARQRGDVGRSAVRVNDLVKLGLVSPDIIHTLDPGGAVYLQRGASGFIPEPPAPAPPGGPSGPTEHGHSWNDLTDLPTCFDPCSHEHPWDEIIDKPDCFDPCSHTHSWEDILNPPALSDFDPGCCGVPIRRCPEGLGNEPFWECLPPEPLEQLTAVDAAAYQFFLADNIPYKQFIYAGGLLVTINLYDDAGLTNLRYAKQLVRTGDFLTSIVLTRHPDLAQWTKTLSYNLDDALETVATAAA